ncbi:erythroblast NAD(P)(+)--arginine ADP-ribosyltransferase-like [Mastacembelus armatus]|uniref:erythroblast NAD(P)(+)--arginine ADP-ribosyltransferase-like n=1 Tax=Mastacembelus armatus TaxID=205130 RepID=UPI000E45D0B2|nr:erythroblast NAD(P)(+)--arginine ADP-ribosyltransferase-like [Mastacembelus armatus]
MNRNEMLVAPLSTPLNPSGFLFFLFFWTLPVSLGAPLQVADRATPLNMIDDAVDDMYDGCKDKMAETVNKMYFAKENTGIFAEAWKDATDCTNDNLKNKAEEDKALTEDHMQAICVYTDHKYKFYDLFNNHVLRNRSIYGTNFPFHYLHFWLTSAIQILNTNTKSHTSYRRTKHEFTGEVGQIMRFGLFASSSYNKTLTSFGSRTCFAIKTYYGGYLKYYSTYKEEE